MKYKDYYKTLGVEKNATEKDIQKAYRNLARKYHPDINKAKDAEAKFKDINEANEVLSDKEKRRKYDTLGSDWDKYQNFDPRQGGYYQDMGDIGGKTVFGNDSSDFFEAFFGSGGSIFDQIFGGRPGSAGGNRTRKSSQQQSRRPQQQHQTGGGFSSPKNQTEEPTHEIEITLNDAFNGSKIVLNINNETEQKKIEVNIPKGVENGTKIRIPGKNNSADIFLKVKIKEHKFFKLDKHDLHCELPITDYEAVLGTETIIPTISGTSVNIKVPPGSHTGKTFRLKNLGMPILKTDSKGDLYVKLKIDIPKHLSEREIELFKSLKDLRTGKDNHIREDLVF